MNGRRANLAVAAAAAVGVAGPLAGLFVVLLGGELERPVAAFLLVVAAVAGLGALLLARRAERYVGELERSRRAFRRAVVRLGDALGASDDREALVRLTLEAAQTLTDADVAAFWIDRGPDILARVALGDTVVDRRVARGVGLVGAVTASLEPVRWPGGATRPGAGEPSGTTALAVPVLARGRLYGVFSLHRRVGDPFSGEDLDDVLGLARQAGGAIDRTYLHEETRRQSITDGLTSLWNRRQFELRAAQELERAVRFGERFSIVLVDLDDFKTVNDTYGHQIGDAVLVETAKRLVAHTREVDTVARYGGEEFVFLLPQTDGPGAVRVAEKVRAELVDLPVTTDAGDIAVSLSAGVASYPTAGTTIEAMLGTADQALYAAKAGGKNRVVHCEIPEHGASPT